MAETLILDRAEIKALVSPREALEPMRNAFRLYSTKRIDHVFFLGSSHGGFFNDVADGFLDKTEVTCAYANDLVGGVSSPLHGYCIVIDKDGDKAFLIHQGKGTGPGKIDGTFKWTGGTGKFAGIQGNNTYRVTSIGKNPAAWIVWEGEWQLP